MTKANLVRTMTPSWDLLRNSYQIVIKLIEPTIYLYLLPTLLALLGLLLAGITSSSTTSSSFAFTSHTVIGLILVAIGGILQIVNLGPLTKFQLDAASGKQKTVKEYYAEGLRYSLPLFVYYILYGLAVLGGLLLLIVPGVIFFRRYYLGAYYLVDKNLGILEAMKQSSTGTKPFKNYVWGVVGVELAVSIAASFTQIIPFVGIVIAQLVTCSYLFMNALRYREIEVSK